jgi:hypothetical protein
MLFPACAFAVHELRYRLAYGSHASAALAAQGHGYLDSLAPWIALLAALGFGSFLVRLARSLAGRSEDRPRRSFVVLWAVASLALLATYAVQEWLEGLFAAGHPGGLEGIVGHGGLWALPLALLAGILVACVLRLASAVVGAVSARLHRRVPRTGTAASSRPRSVPALRRAPLAACSAGRAPPRGRRVAFA